jgi:hypothetical protein
VLDALAFSPIRRRVVPQSLPSKLSPELRTTVARLGTRLPEIAHIFAIEPEESAGRRPPARVPGRGASRGKKARPGPQPAAEAGGATSAASDGPAESGPAGAPPEAREAHEATAQ